MSHSFLRNCLAIIVAVASFAATASAHDYTVGTLKIVHPWMRVPPPAAKVAGGFMKITNTGSTPDRLIGGSVAFAGRFEVHEMSVVDGVMRMRELKSGIEIAPGATIELKPGSYHTMFFDITSHPAVGSKAKGTLVFEKAGTIEIEYKVEAATTKSSGHEHGGKSPAPSGKGSGSGSGSGAAGHGNQ